MTPDILERLRRQAQICLDDRRFGLARDLIDAAAEIEALRVHKAFTRTSSERPAQPANWPQSAYDAYAALVNTTLTPEAGVAHTARKPRQ